MLAVLGLRAQELQVKVNINHSQITGTDVSVFENLQQSIEQFINERQWTPLQFQKHERIQCVFNITINAYIRETNHFECTALIQANRPVYNSSYTTTLYNNKDENFDFAFAQFDQLNFRDEMVDQQLTALLAYYAYLIIGLNLDSFAPMAGTDILQRCMYLVNNAQQLDAPGWKPFEDNTNRNAVLSALTDAKTAPIRQVLYDYHRMGLDQMVVSVDKGRATITHTLENLGKIYEVAPLSVCLAMFKDAKLDELINIYSKANMTEKESVYEMLYQVYPSETTRLEEIKKESRPTL
jgi:hypothetical protein